MNLIKDYKNLDDLGIINYYRKCQKTKNKLNTLVDDLDSVADNDIINGKTINQLQNTLLTYISALRQEINKFYEGSKFIVYEVEDYLIIYSIVQEQSKKLAEKEFLETISAGYSTGWITDIKILDTEVTDVDLAMFRRVIH